MAPCATPEDQKDRRQHQFDRHQQNENRMRRTDRYIRNRPADAADEKQQGEERHIAQIAPQPHGRGQ